MRRTRVIAYTRHPAFNTNYKEIDMSKEEFDTEVGYYLGDIRKFTSNGDFSSAQIMVSGLRKLIAEYKKSKK